jgi:hypothetical protein
MNAVFASMEDFQFQLNAKEKPGILGTHHTTKNGMNYRGSSAIHAAVDAAVQMTRAPRDNIARYCVGLGFDNFVTGGISMK